MFSRRAGDRQDSVGDAFASGLVPVLLAGLLIDAITWWFEQEQPGPPRQIAISCYNLVLSTLKEVSRWE